MKVLVVDDNADTRFITLGILRKLNCEVEVCADPQTVFLEFADAHPFDVILVDSTLSEARGGEFARSIRRKYPAARVVFTSASSPEDYQQLFSLMGK